jgi:hypothetical protein
MVHECGLSPQFIPDRRSVDSYYVDWIISQKPQEALNLLVTEERYWALFYMALYMSNTTFIKTTVSNNVLLYIFISIFYICF